MTEKNTNVDSTSIPTPLPERVPGRGDTTEPKDNAQLALDRLFEHIHGHQQAFTEQKRQLDDMRKLLGLFKVSPDRIFAFSDLPITREVIEQATNALKNGGENVKGLQRALGIFDTSELTRIRKALAVAGVTRETENYRGTNATFIELTPEFTGGTQDEETEAGDESVHEDSGDESQSEANADPVKPAATAPKKK